jgi:hypothetical protein
MWSSLSKCCITLRSRSSKNSGSRPRKWKVPEGSSISLSTTCSRPVTLYLTDLPPRGTSRRTGGPTTGPAAPGPSRSGSLSDSHREGEELQSLRVGDRETESAPPSEVLQPGSCTVLQLFLHGSTVSSEIEGSALHLTIYPNKYDLLTRSTRVHPIELRDGIATMTLVHGHREDGERDQPGLQDQFEGKHDLWRWGK